MTNDKSAALEAVLKYANIDERNPEFIAAKEILSTPDAKDEGGAVKPELGPQPRWVNCPICHEPDMRLSGMEGEYLIHCVNHGCASNRPSQPQAVAEPIDGLDDALEALYGDANLIALNNSPRMAALFEAARRFRATPPAKDTASEEVKLTPELYLICLCAWNNVAVDNTAMIKYTEENFGKVGTDGWKRVATALKAALSRGEDLA